MDFFLNLVGSEAVGHWLTEVAFSKLAFWAFAFAVAAKFHQKEIAKQFSGIVAAIKEVGDALRDSIEKADARHAKLEARVVKLEVKRDESPDPVDPPPRAA